jgi:two-component system sensor histidine kinase KdpD
MAGPLAALAAAGLERAGAVRRAGNAAAEAQAEGLRAAILDALAHEFKTPLATILTAAGGLREAGPLGPAQTELAELVETEAERLSHLSTRLLRLAKLDREDVKPRQEPANLVSIVAKAIERYSRQWPERRFLFDKRGKSSQILADGGLVQLAVSQLIDNACRYSPVDSAVKVSVEFDDLSAIVIVWNSGAAIPPTEAARIFDRFFRGVEAQKVSSGSGLGLYVARKIAVAHGGSLELDYNQDDGGVAFRFTFPLLVEGF